MKLNELDSGIQYALNKVSETQHFVDKTQALYDSGVRTTEIFRDNDWVSLKTEDLLNATKSELVSNQVYLKNITAVRDDLQSQLDNFTKANPV